MPDPNWLWLRTTNELQRITYGYEFEKWPIEELCDYIQWNLYAAGIELAEASVEFSWKPWAVDAPFVNRQRMLDELVDVNHFIGNILVGMGVTDEEWALAYQKKQEKNRQRAASGSYSAKKGALGEGSDI